MRNILMVANAAYGTAALLVLVATARRVGVTVPRWARGGVYGGAACWATVTAAACWTGEAGTLWYSAVSLVWSLIQVVVALAFMRTVRRCWSEP